MALNNLVRKVNNGRDIKYLNKDFAQFRQNLIEYTKTYFPQTYSDFNESSPGMLFIEMASYLGDVMSYYIDDSLKESFMTFAEDKQSVIALSEYLGYKPKVTSPAIARLSVYQTIPSTQDQDGNYQPDSRYYLRIKEGMEVRSSDTGTLFRTTETVDFSVDDEREISKYDTDQDGSPIYLVKKYVNCISAELRTLTTNFGTTPQQFSTVNLGDTNVIQIYDVRDSNGNKWYEVPYLAQEMVYVDYPASQYNDMDMNSVSGAPANVLKLIKTSRRFTTKINEDNSTSLVFGGGTATNDETLIPNFKNVGLGLPSSIDRLGASFDPSNFLKTTSYGQAPTGEFTISYLVGGGISSNVASEQLVQVDRIEFDEDTSIFTPDELRTYNSTKASVAADNQEPARGGRGAETIEEIRQNALGNFGSQNRAVTRKDYEIRTLSLPAKYGSISKAFCAPDGQLDNNSPQSILNSPDTLEEFTGLIQSLKDRNLTEQEIKNELTRFLKGKQGDVSEKNNPFAVNLYILGYNSTKKLATLNRAVKENLKTYLQEFRMLTDGINIIDGFIINIGLEYEIRVYGGYNKREVLTKVQQELSNYFNIDNWTFNMPINISEVELIIAGVEGVQSVPKCEIVNKCRANNGRDYSQYSYNITEATKNKMVFPSLDPSVFELKYPNRDIKGRVV